MKLKNKHFYYALGLVVTFITVIPTLPNALKYLLALIPILFFGADLTLRYMEEFYKKNYINRHLTGIIAALALIVTGRLPYAALTMIFFSAADHFFYILLDRASRRIEDSARINAPYAKVFAEGRAVRVSADSVVPGQILVIEVGDIIPCDSTVINGEGELDYTNVFGKGELRVAKAGSPCFSGGILQAGKLTLKALKPAKDSLASLISYRTKKAQTPSKLQKKICVWAKLLEKAFYLLALLLFIILIIATKDFALSVNQAAVVLVASPVMGLMGTLPVLNRNALLCARKRGVIYTDIASLEQSGKLKTVSANEPLADEVRIKIEETKVIPAKGGYTAEDAVLYRDTARLEADPNPSFKLALGFFSKKAQATALDSKPVRIAGAIRTGQHHRGVFMQNILCLGVEKLALIAMLFLFNISPAAAIVIEFAAWMLCLLNATKDL